MAEAGIALRVRGLSAGYGGFDVLRGIDVDIRDGAMTGIIGPNGAGKSTFLKALIGQTRTGGTVELLGKPLRDLRPIAYVPQRAAVDFAFPITALEVASQGTYASLPWWRRPGRSEREWALECLDVVGMASVAHEPIGALSGGQAARVFIARALAQRPAAFLLDEPFAAIDVASAERIHNVLRRQADDGKAVVTVHHNLDQVAEFFDHIIVLAGDLIAAGPVDKAFTPAVLARAFPDAQALADLSSEAGES